MPYKGQCLCGEIKYEVAAIGALIGHCHCKMCRKFHGADYSTLGDVLRQDLTWLSGEGYLKSFTADNGTVRQFCEQCGSSLTFASSRPEDADTIEIALGTLDSPFKGKANAHIFLESKGDWVSLSDKLPKFLRHRNGKRVS